jgi:plastocyanin
LKRWRPALVFVLAADIVAGVALILCAQPAGVDVVAHVKVHEFGTALERSSHSDEGVVLWLTPVDNSPAKLATAPLQHYQLAQKNKQFQPHLLVIPAGSIVDFPNLDPFFHNVFSLFNGRKFDLGLYESGKTRSVHFDRPGVSFIFCNIHPEMSAVVVSVPTPYFASSTPDGSLIVHNVAPGTYDMHLWAIGSGDNLSSAQLHRVIVVDVPTDLGAFTVQTAPVGPHKNKFGEDYDLQRPQQY